MSLGISNLAWNADCQNHTAKLVLVALADHANDAGKCWPSVTFLAEKCSMSRQGVLDQIEKLIKDGHVTADKNPGKSTYYTVHPVSKIERAESRKRAQPVHHVDQSTSLCDRPPQDAQPVYAIDYHQSIPLTAPVYPIDSNHKEPSLNHQLADAHASAEMLFPDLPPPASIPTEPKAKKPRKKKESVADPRFTVFRDIFINAYEEATGTPYAFQGGKDGKALSQFLKTFKDVDEAAFRHAINWCREVAGGNAYAAGCVRQTSNLAAFCSSWNQIVEYFQTYTPPSK